MKCRRSVKSNYFTALLRSDKSFKSITCFLNTHWLLLVWRVLLIEIQLLAICVPPDARHWITSQCQYVNYRIDLPFPSSDIWYSVVCSVLAKSIWSMWKIHIFCYRVIWEYRLYLKNISIAIVMYTEWMNSRIQYIFCILMIH